MGFQSFQNFTSQMCMEEHERSLFIFYFAFTSTLIHELLGVVHAQTPLHYVFIVVIDHRYMLFVVVVAEGYVNPIILETDHYTRS